MVTLSSSKSAFFMFKENLKGPEYFITFSVLTDPEYSIEQLFVTSTYKRTVDTHILTHAHTHTHSLALSFMRMERITHFLLNCVASKTRLIIRNVIKLSHAVNYKIHFGDINILINGM